MKLLGGKHDLDQSSDRIEKCLDLAVLGLEGSWHETTLIAGLA